MSASGQRIYNLRSGYPISAFAGLPSRSLDRISLQSVRETGQLDGSATMRSRES
jgi:hypothetical protein